MKRTQKKEPAGGGLKWRRVLALVVLCLACWSNAWSANYYVSPQGSDAHSGTVDQPFKTLAAAAGKVLPGDRVLIAAGVYAEMLEIKRSGTAEAPIRFQARENAAVVIDATGLRHGVIIWNAHHVEVNGLTVENAYGTGIHIHDHQDGGLGSDYNRIEANTVRRCGSQGFNGIYVGGHHNQVTANQILDNGIVPNDPAASGHGIYVLGSFNQVQGNTVRGSGRVGIRLEGEENIFEDNIIEANRDFGMTVWVDAPMKGERIVIRGNTVRDNQRGGICLYGQGDGQKPDNITISANTIADPEGAEYGIRIIEGCRNIKVVGNTFNGLYRTAMLYVDIASMTGFSAYQNQYQGSGAFYLGGDTYAGISAYQQACLADPVHLRAVP